MNAFAEAEETIYSRESIGYGGRFYAAYPALVTDVRDPDNQGRVKVSLPWSPDSSGSSYSAWARISTFMAGNKQGSWFIPDTNVEVLVIFLGGDPRNPCVIGALWNGQDAPPQSMDGAGNNTIKQICSRTGIKITMDDTPGTQSLTLETPGGQKIILQDGPGSILLQDSNQNSIKLDTSGVTIDSASTVSITGPVSLSVTAGSVMVNSASSTFNGMTTHNTVMTSSIVAASYTPGAGNMW